MATKNKTHPSCAKVEVDLLGEFPKRIKIGIKKGGESFRKVGSNKI